MNVHFKLHNLFLSNRSDHSIFILDSEFTAPDHTRKKKKTDHIEEIPYYDRSTETMN